MLYQLTNESRKAEEISPVLYHSGHCNLYDQGMISLTLTMHREMSILRCVVNQFQKLTMQLL